VRAPKLPHGVAFVVEHADMVPLHSAAAIREERVEDYVLRVSVEAARREVAARDAGPLPYRQAKTLEGQHRRKGGAPQE